SAARRNPAAVYATALHRAWPMVTFAERRGLPSIQQAIDVLVQETGRSQPEVLRDLRQAPPDLADADQRLQALYTTLQARVDTPDPASARDQLQRILSQPRYSGLRAGPSLLEQILSFIVHKIADFLSLAGVGNLRLNVPIRVWLGP